MRVLAAQINPTVGDIDGNSRKIIETLQRAHSADIVLFPELALCGYFPDDLLLDRTFINAMERKLEEIRPHTKGLFAVVGLARLNHKGKEKHLYNSAAVFADGKLIGFKNKTLLPTYDVFDERRYFDAGEQEPIWEYKGRRISITICEDVWGHSGKLEGSGRYERDPLKEIKQKRPDLCLNLSGSPYYYERLKTRVAVFQQAAKMLGCPVILCNQVGANDQLVFDGHSCFIDAKGALVRIARGFAEEDFWVDVDEKSFKNHEDTPLEDLYSALVLGVRDYFCKQGFQKALIGLSGGIDSALVACIAKEALGPQNVLALALPSRFSSEGSVSDAKRLAQNLGIQFKEISIEPLFKQYLNVLEPLFQGKPFDQTEENLQSRIRGMLLMAYSNKFGYILLNTGNKSEMAMGYCTLYGDMAGGLAVLQDVTKCKIYELASLISCIPEAILKKVPSAELREHQTDFDTLPPYEVLDPILEDYVEEGLGPEEIATRTGHSLDLVLQIIRKIHQNEFKRRQAPIGIRVTRKAFSKGRVVPIVQKWK